MEPWRRTFERNLLGFRCGNLLLEKMSLGRVVIYFGVDGTLSRAIDVKLLTRPCAKFLDFSNQIGCVFFLSFQLIELAKIPLSVPLLYGLSLLNLLLLPCLEQLHHLGFGCGNEVVFLFFGLLRCVCLIQEDLHQHLDLLALLLNDSLESLDFPSQLRSIGVISRFRRKLFWFRLYNRFRFRFGLHFGFLWFLLDFRFRCNGFGSTSCDAPSAARDKASRSKSGFLRHGWLRAFRPFVSPIKKAQRSHFREG